MLYLIIIQTIYHSNLFYNKITTCNNKIKSTNLTDEYNLLMNFYSYFEGVNK